MKTYVKLVLFQIIFITICFAGNKASFVFSDAKITFDKQSGAPKDIVFTKDKKPTVESFFQTYISAFNLTSDNSFSEFRSHKDKLGQIHHRYKQYYKGIELAQVQYLLHEQNGLVHHAHGKLIHGLQLDVTPAISEFSALQFALNHVNAQQYVWENPVYKVIFKNSYPQGRLMLSAGNKEPLAENFRLVYRFDIYTAIPFGGYAVDVDAKNGKIVGKLPLVYQDDVQGYGQSLYNGLVPVTVSDNNFPKPTYAHLDSWNAFGGSGQSWWFADPALGNEGGYDNNWYQVLDTDPITISGDNPLLTFYHRYSTEIYDDSQPYADYDGWDGMNVRISIDSGTTWQVLENPVPAYSDSNIYSFAFIYGEDNGIPGWSGLMEEWTKVTFDLSSFLNNTVQIRFAFASDLGASSADFLPELFGWQIDEISVTNSSDTLFVNNGSEDGLTPKAIYREYEDMNYRLWEYSRGEGIFTKNCLVDEDYWVVNFLEYLDEDSLFNDDSDRTGVSAHWATEATYDYYMSRFGRDSYDDKGSPINSYTDYYFHYPNGAITPNNAMWRYSLALYGKGDGIYCDPLVSVDIVGHEITHGVTQYSADLIYQNESGALNESFSDIFGTAIEFYVEGENLDWLHGEDVTISGYGRSLENPKSKNDPDTYKGQYWVPGATEPAWENDYGGVHTNSGVQNHWFYLLSEGGNGTNDNGDIYSVSGIGIEDAEQIAYRNLTVYLQPTSTYFDAAQYSLQSAIDLFGEGSEQYQAVLDAWYAVGIHINQELNTNKKKLFFLAEVGATEALNITIKNKGLDTLEIADINIINNKFIISNKPQMPKKLAYNKSITLRCIYYADTDADVSDTLLIKSNDTQSPETSISLLGRVFTPAQEGYIYAVTGNSSKGKGLFLARPADSSGFHKLGESGYSELLGIARHPEDKRLYATTSFQGSTWLLKLDPRSGLNRKVVEIPLASVAGITFGSIDDINSGNNYLYCADLYSGILYTVDLHTGDTTRIGSTGISSLTGLTINPQNGMLYGTSASDNVIYQIDKTNADTIRVGVCTEKLHDITFSDDGRLFGLAFDGYDTRLFNFPLGNYTDARDNGFIGFGYVKGLVASGTVTDLEKENRQISSAFKLFPNYPNPFNPKTTIEFEIPASQWVELSIYNILGQKVVTLVNNKQKAGTHQVQWDASSFPSGTYFVRLQSKDMVTVRKCLLIR